MTDDQEVRELLIQAAELPDSVQPPVQRLIERGRARRTRRAILSAACAAVVVAAVAALPSVLSGAAPKTAAGHAPSGLIGPGTPAESGPSAAELSRFRWSALPSSPLGHRSNPLLAWTGKELIELGGPARQDSTGAAAFSPARRTWRRIAQVPDSIGLTGAVTVWTGQQLFVTNGRFPSEWPPTVGPPAGMYNPATNQWKTVFLPRQMEGLAPVAAVWTGRDVVVGFVRALGTSGKLGVAAYDPATNHWRVITPTLPPHHSCQYIAMVATSNRLILWSLWDRVQRYKHGAAGYSGVDVLALGQDGTWRDVTGRWPQSQTVTSPVFTGSAILASPSQIWCGTFCSPPYTYAYPGSFADPATLHRTVIPLGPLGQANPAFAWTGREIIAVNLDMTGGRPPLRPDDMALYDPATGRWSRLPATPGYPSLVTAPVWAGTQLLALTDSGALWSFLR